MPMLPVMVTGVSVSKTTRRHRITIHTIPAPAVIGYIIYYRAQAGATEVIRTTKNDFACIGCFGDFHR